MTTGILVHVLRRITLLTTFPCTLSGLFLIIKKTQYASLTLILHSYLKFLSAQQALRQNWAMLALITTYRQILGLDSCGKYHSHNEIHIEAQQLWLVLT